MEPIMQNKDMKDFIKIITLCFALALMNGCGKKPSHLDPPAEHDPDYPRQYPAPLPNEKSE
jgi:predicted small lipoprotein YifL